MKPILLPYRGVSPTISEAAFVAPGSSVIGDVRVGAGSSVWFGAVLRGDVMPITVGEGTSIQDNSVVHATGGWSATEIGDDCTIGHGVIIHGCRIASRVLVGMGTIILDDAEVGSDTLIGAGSLVTARTKIPAGVLAFGRPAKPRRDLTEEELANIREAALTYRHKTTEYLEICAE